MKDLIIDIEKIKSPYSGLGQFCLHLSQALLKLNTELDLGFYSPLGKEHGKEYPGITYKVNRLHRFFPGLLPKSRVWHAIHQEAPYIPRQAKLILTIHDMNYMYKNKSAFLKRKFLRQLGKKIKRASHIVFISEFTKKETQKYFAIPSEKMSVIYNGVDHSTKKEVPSFPVPEKFFLSIGIVLAKKNFHVLLDLMELRDESLIIAGENKGAYGDSIRKKIKEKNLEKRVFLVGKVKDEEKNWLLEHCAAFLFPSLFEGFGIPVIESMARGKATFASQKSSLPEICGNHAYYFKDFDPPNMSKTIEEGLRDFNAGKARDMIEWRKQYNWERAAKAYLEIYKRFI